MSTPAQRVGALGERIAAERYRAWGYTIVARNLHVDGYEADLVVERRGMRILVEVKTILGDGDPWGRMDAEKEIALDTLASALGAHRIDAVGIRLRPDGAHVHTVHGWE